MLIIRLIGVNVRGSVQTLLLSCYIIILHASCISGKLLIITISKNHSIKGLSRFLAIYLEWYVCVFNVYFPFFSGEKVTMHVDYYFFGYQV